LAILVLFLAATLGYLVAYIFGGKIGPRLFKRKDSLLFKQENVKKAQDFYDKHGGKTIVLARFVPIVRTFVPLIAGIGKMKYKTFMTFNLIGGALWIFGVTYFGYFLGAWLTSIGVDPDTVLLPIVALILIVSIAPALYHLLREKPRRQAVWSATKQQCRRILKRDK
jgi:membrane-associated protein